MTSTPSLHRFFDPTGVAVIGASVNPRKLSHGILRNLISYGYSGVVHPVNPSRSSIMGLPCYPGIAQVPDPLDLAVISLPAAMCSQILDDCGHRGIKAAIVISGGFREVGPHGQALEQELVRIARHHDMRLIGPNCVGIIDAYTGLNTTFIRTMPRPGYIAFISQSGAICGGILEWTAGKGVGFSRFATLGNEADVDESDLIETLAADPNTRVIVAYLEAIKDGRRFLEVASRVTPHKPILVLKAGRTEAGARAISSHTGSLAGEMAAYGAAFKQSGVVRIDTIEELFNGALALAYGSLPRGNRVAVLTNAGGPASLAADTLEQSGMAMPIPGEPTQAFLRQCNHPDAQLGNPIDMLGGAEPANYEAAVAALLDDPVFDAVLPILVPQALVDPVAVAEAIGRAATPGGRRNKPVVACFMGDDAVREPMQVMHRHHIAAYQFPEQAAKALGTMWTYATRQPASLSTDEVPGLKAERLQVTEVLERAAAAGRTELVEWECRPLLAAYGIPQPRANLARSADEAAQMAAELGFPVALKVVSPNVLHKSEVGGIALGLANEAAVQSAFDSMLGQVRQRQPEARIEGVLVAQMAPSGHELVVGMRRDPQFGPLLMFGLGGIYVELLKDVAFRVVPCDRTEILRMIGETHAGRLLEGLRNQPPADTDAVVDVVERIAQMAMDQPRMQEVDLNPLVAYEQSRGVLALDVRIFVR